MWQPDNATKRLRSNGYLQDSFARLMTLWPDSSAIIHHLLRCLREDLQRQQNTTSPCLTSSKQHGQRTGDAPRLCTRSPPVDIRRQHAARRIGSVWVPVITENRSTLLGGRFWYYINSFTGLTSSIIMVRFSARENCVLNLFFVTADKRVKHNECNRESSRFNVDWKQRNVHYCANVCTAERLPVCRELKWLFNAVSE